MACKNCSDCVATKCLPACLSNIIIGIFEPNTDYYIYIEDVTTGQLILFSATADGAGVLQFALGAFEPMPDHSYMLWITLTNQNIDHEEIITIPYGLYSVDSTASCLSLRFEYVEDSEANKILYEKMEIEVLQWMF